MHRQIALKVIKLGMDTREFIARFEAERHALALMEHPNIAKVFDAGATKSGRPYLVMELVRGIPITTFCDQKRLQLAERIELFVQVCKAVQHAHQKGIIHRDLKPSNILVAEHDGVPVPKVIDFGIAKTAQTQRANATALTAIELFIGTPAYTSPEQADLNPDIDTRADIFSLGVLLHELLTGHLPIVLPSLKNVGVDEIRNIIRSHKAQPPSKLLVALGWEDIAILALNRDSKGGELIAALRGDLDCIVLCCLEKDRTRRYQTANGLALDLQRHLRGEPIAARPASAAYILQTFFRRHRAAVAMSFAILVVGAIGAIASVRLAVRAMHAEGEQRRLRMMEAEHRHKAEERAYAADMNLLQQAVSVGHQERARELLERYRPDQGERDLRGWEWRYLWQYSRGGQFKTLSAPEKIVTSVVSAKEGGWLAFGGFEGHRVINLNTQQEMHVKVGAPAAFSPRGPILAGLSRESKNGRTLSRVSLWNVETGRPLLEIPIEGNCNGLSFSADGETLVTSSGGPNGRITRWRVASGENLGEMAAPTSGNVPHDPFAVTASGTIAAYATKDGELRVIDLATGRQCWSAKAAKEWVVALAFSPNGAVLASAAGFTESAIRLWDVATGRQLAVLNGHHSYVNALEFTSDGLTLISAGGDSTIRIWNIETGEMIHTLHGHSREIYSLTLLPDGRTLASGGNEDSIYLWNVFARQNRPTPITLPARIKAWRFSTDGQSILTLDEQGIVEQWSGASFQTRVALLETGSSGADYRAVVFAKDAPLVAKTVGKNRVEVWDWERRTKVCELNTRHPNAAVLDFTGAGRKLLVAVGSEPLAGPPWKLVQEWILPEGHQGRSWPIMLAGYPAAAVSPDEATLVVTGGYSGYARINLRGSDSKMPVAWDFDHGGNISAFSADGRFFASPTRMGFARIWESRTWREIATLRGFRQTPASIAFYPDTSRVALASGGTQGVTLYSMGNFEQLLTLETDDSILWQTAFSPKGDYLGTLSRWMTLTLWRAPSWEEIATAETKQWQPEPHAP